MKPIENLNGIDENKLKSFIVSILEEIKPGKKVTFPPKTDPDKMLVLTV